MSPASVTAIRQPRDLHMPAADPATQRAFLAALELLESQQFWAFAGDLSEYGRVSLVRELVEAIIASQKDNNLVHVQKVLDAWYRTSLFVGRPEYREALSRLRSEPLPAAISDEQIKALLGL